MIPKLAQDWRDKALFPFYAGFSYEFARDVIRKYADCQNSTILDPWNGSGTTTGAAASLGLKATGVDLNPVMVLAAKARLVESGQDLSSIAQEILELQKSINERVGREDPLNAWVKRRTVRCLRNLKQAIEKRLVQNGQAGNYTSYTPEACFFHVVLFRTARKLLSKFVSSNPTWTKRPKDRAARISVTAEKVISVFEEQLDLSIQNADSGYVNADVSFLLGSSTQLSTPDCEFDLVLGSPPYCTRIDYAVATEFELAVLGLGRGDEDFKRLRKQLLGTTSIYDKDIQICEDWGQTCAGVLRKIRDHDSHASKRYYYHNHKQYFSSLYASLTEITRTLKAKGRIVLVVQDSYYKDVHNDLARIVTEMGDSLSLKLLDRYDYSRCSKASINQASRAYNGKAHRRESVLVLCKHYGERM